MKVGNLTCGVRFNKDGIVNIVNAISDIGIKYDFTEEDALWLLETIKSNIDAYCDPNIDLLRAYRAIVESKAFNRENKIYREALSYVNKHS